MTEPRQPASTEPTARKASPEGREGVAPLEGGSAEGARPARPGLRTFTLEGRAAPGLFLVGWLGSITGVGLILVGGLASAGPVKSVIFAAGLGVLGVGLVAAAGSQALDRRAQDAAYRGPSPFLVFAAVVPLTLLAVLLIFRPLVGLGIRPEAPAATLVAIGVQAAVYVGLVRLLVLGPGALRWSEMGFERAAAEIPLDFARGAILALPILVVTIVVAAFLVGFLGTRPESPLPPAANGPDLLLNLISASVIAPFGEETFFRGFATTAWARTYGARRAIIQAGLFFALAHILTVNSVDFSEGTRQAIIAFTARVPVALALGWVFLTRRSIYASMGLHSAFNAFALLLSLSQT